MEKRIIVFAFLLALVVTACSLFQKDSFQGTWQLKFSGGIEETFDFVVGEGNSFSVNKSITYDSREYDVEISGKIGKDGKIRTAIIASGQDMGLMEGEFNYETGKGKWNANILYGEWTATKK